MEEYLSPGTPGDPEVESYSGPMIMKAITASLAHEVSQPIAAILCNAQAALRWLEGRPPNLHEARRALGSIAKSGEHAGDIVGSIRRFVMNEPSQERSFEVNKTILDAVALIRKDLLRHRISLTTQLADGLPSLEGDEVLLQQVVLTLIRCAVDAMRDMQVGPRELSISSSYNDRKAILVMMRNSGPGLTAEAADRLFEAFYTTKRDGMGMDFAICRSIIEARGGRIWASANEPRGIVFHFTLLVRRLSNDRQLQELEDTLPAIRVSETGLERATLMPRDAPRNQLAAPGPVGRQERQRARLQSFIDSRLYDPDLSVDCIARACNMSVRSVHRAFAFDEPGSVSKYIRMRRVCHCAADLRDPRQANRSITDICFSWGFNSTSHFSRLFKEQLGVTPRDYREAFERM